MLQLVLVLKDGGEFHKAWGCPCVGAAARLCSFNQRGFIQARDNGLPFAVSPESCGSAAVVKGRNGRTFQRRQADEMDRTSLLRHFSGGGHNIVLVVFTICEHDHNARGFAALIKTIPAHTHGLTHCGSLHRNHSGVDGFQEQVERFNVCGQGALHVGVSGKDHEANAVAGCGCSEAFDGSFGQVKPRHAHVLRHHAVADIQGDHHVHPFRFDFLKFAAHFGIEPGNGQCADGHSPKQKFPCGSKQAVVGQHAVDAAGIRKALNGFVTPTQMAQHQDGQQEGYAQNRGRFLTVKGQAGDE